MYPKLTSEEFQALLLYKRDFLDLYDIKTIPLYRQVATGLHHLAVSKSIGGYVNWRTHEWNEVKKNIQEATIHYLKACLYDPKYLSFSATREAFGLS
jgi:hypothetical protein